MTYTSELLIGKATLDGNKSENIERTIASLKQGTIGYNQTEWHRTDYDNEDNACGTVCCIAGHACSANINMGVVLTEDSYHDEELNARVSDGNTIFNHAMQLLGLTGDGAQKLFYCDRIRTVEDAVAILEHLLVVKRNDEANATSPEHTNSLDAMDVQVCMQLWFEEKQRADLS